MASKLKAKIYMVGCTSGIEVEIKDKEKFTADALREEQKQLSKALNIVRETVFNLVDDGK